MNSEQLVAQVKELALTAAPEDKEARAEVPTLFGLLTTKTNAKGEPIKPWVFSVKVDGDQYVVTLTHAKYGVTVHAKSKTLWDAFVSMEVALKSPNTTARFWGKGPQKKTEEAKA